MKLKILHLYPKEMNLYGDHGNVLAIKRRCEWRGIDVEVVEHEPGNKIPDDIDIIFGGGGQDSGQGKIEDDLQAITPKLKDLINKHQKGQQRNSHRCGFRRHFALSVCLCCTVTGRQVDSPQGLQHNSDP